MDIFCFSIIQNPNDKKYQGLLASSKMIGDALRIPSVVKVLNSVGFTKSKGQYLRIDNCPNYVQLITEGVKLLSEERRPSNAKSENTKAAQLQKTTSAPMLNRQSSITAKSAADPSKKQVHKLLLLEPNGVLKELPVVTSSLQPLVTVASRLLGINGKTLLDQPYIDSLKMLKNAHFPLTLQLIHPVCKLGGAYTWDSYTVTLTRPANGKLGLKFEHFKTLQETIAKLPLSNKKLAEDHQSASGHTFRDSVFGNYLSEGSNNSDLSGLITQTSNTLKITMPGSETTLKHKTEGSQKEEHIVLPEGGNNLHNPSIVMSSSVPPPDYSSIVSRPSQPNNPVVEQGVVPAKVLAKVPAVKEMPKSLVVKNGPTNAPVRKEVSAKSQLYKSFAKQGEEMPKAPVVKNGPTNAQVVKNVPANAPVVKHGPVNAPVGKNGPAKSQMKKSAKVSIKKKMSKTPVVEKGPAHVPVTELLEETELTVNKAPVKMDSVPGDTDDDDDFSDDLESDMSSPFVALPDFSSDISNRLSVRPSLSLAREMFVRDIDACLDTDFTGPALENMIATMASRGGITKKEKFELQLVCQRLDAMRICLTGAKHHLERACL